MPTCFGFLFASKFLPLTQQGFLTACLICEPTNYMLVCNQFQPQGFTENIKRYLKNNRCLCTIFRQYNFPKLKSLYKRFPSSTRLHNWTAINKQNNLFLHIVHKYSQGRTGCQKQHTRLCGWVYLSWYCLIMDQVIVIRRRSTACKSTQKAYQPLQSWF